MTKFTPLDWLPNCNCKFKYSAHARYISVRVPSYNNVVVTLPKYVSHAQALRFVNQQRNWITQQLDRLSLIAFSGPPKRIKLPALDLDLSVYIKYSHSDFTKLHHTPDGLYLTGNCQSQEIWHPLLTQWLRDQARQAFLPVLTQQATRMNVRYGRLSVRLQRSRWGSCNSYGDISLNAKLLFLRPSLVQHVVIHELAHTRHLNHSPVFWKFIESADPNWRVHRRELRQGYQLLPDWLDL